MEGPIGTLVVPVRITVLGTLAVITNLAQTLNMIASAVISIGTIAVTRALAPQSLTLLCAIDPVGTFVSKMSVAVSIVCTVLSDVSHTCDVVTIIMDGLPSVACCSSVIIVYTLMELRMTILHPITASIVHMLVTA